MPLKIVRNDITQMNTEAIVNTANADVAVGSGCDMAVYKAAGEKKLLEYRRENIGQKKEGDVFITPGFKLKAKYIIHAVSPIFEDGDSGEEDKLRLCYSRSLQLAADKGIRSIAFPLISTGSFGYPKEEGLRIAADEISSFLLSNDMEIFLVVFDSESTKLGRQLTADLERYIDNNYVRDKVEEEYFTNSRFSSVCERRIDLLKTVKPNSKECRFESVSYAAEPVWEEASEESFEYDIEEDIEYDEELDFKLRERMEHLSDTFSEYLMFLIENKGLTNADVYKNAIVDKKVFSKIKNNPDYHPQKITAMCLCIGAKLNMDETKDLLARAGYALSPSDKTDVIFSYFIENEIYDMIELDIRLEEYGQKCLIS